MNARNARGISAGSSKHSQGGVSASRNGRVFLSLVIRRPLFILAVFFALGIALGRYLDIRAAYIISAAGFAAAALIYAARAKNRYKDTRKKNTAIPFFVCLAALSAAALLSSGAYYAEHIAVGDGMAVEGRVYAQPYTNDYGSTVCVLDSVRIDGSSAGNVKLYIEEPGDIKCGDSIALVADVELPKGVRNPGGFDEKLYLLSQGIQYKAYADSAKITGSGGGLGIAFSHAREYLGDTIDLIFDSETAPVAKAMLLGDTQGIDEQTYTDFKDTGMAHVLAVSGLNAAILIAFIYYVLKLLKVGRTPRLIAALVFVMLYTCVTGLTPSIVRAAIMAGALLLGTHFGRQNDTLNYLSLAFIVSLLLRPLDLFNVGFQLSFAAVFGMITVGWQARRLWMRAFNSRLSRTGNAVSASIGASAGTAPILASAFNRLSTLSIFINLVIIPLASAATVLVFIAAVLGTLLGSAASFAAFPASTVIKAMLFIIKAASDVSFVAVDTASPQLLFVIVCFVVMYLSSKYHLASVKLKAAVSTALVAAVIAAGVLLRFTGLYIVFLDTGQSDAVFIKTEQGGEYFIDGGREASAREILSFTVRRGYTPDAAFVSHTDDDHFSGIKALCEAELLGRVYCSWQEKDVVEAALPQAEVVPLSAGDTVWLDDMTSALVLYPYRDTQSKDKNDASLVLLIEYRGKNALFTGDISGVTETEIFAPLTGADIYKAAHHGSKRSSYRLPLSVLRPEYSVICVGKNRYGQPDALAAANLSDYSGEVYNTMDDYAVEFYIAEDISVNTYGEAE